MMFFLKSLLPLLFLSSLIASEELLPPDGFLGKWHKQAPARTFKGSDLYGHINGGSELFLEFGFEELTVQDYVEGTNEFSLELYRMTDSLAAQGIFLMKKGRESVSLRLPVPHVIGPFQLVFLCDRYFVILNNYEGEARHEEAMLEFARYLINRLPAHQDLDPARFLPAGNLVPGSARLLRGTYALQSIFTLGEGNILSLSPGQTAAAGDYSEDGTTFTRVVCDYPASRVATAAFEHLANHLDPYLKVIERSQRVLVFRDYTGEYGSAVLDGTRLEVRIHLKARP